MVQFEFSLLSHFSRFVKDVLDELVDRSDSAKPAVDFLKLNESTLIDSLKSSTFNGLAAATASGVLAQSSLDC